MITENGKKKFTAKLRKAGRALISGENLVKLLGDSMPKFEKDEGLSSSQYKSLSENQKVAYDYRDVYEQAKKMPTGRFFVQKNFLPIVDNYKVEAAKK